MASYYVWSGGNNTNGLSWDNAFYTPQQAANVVSAGDTIYVAPGTYARTGYHVFNCEAEGAEDNRITLFGQGAGIPEKGVAPGNVTFVGTGTPLWTIGVRSYTTVDGINVVGGNRAIFSAAETAYPDRANGVIVQNCNISQSTFKGILIAQGKGAQIINNTIHDFIGGGSESNCIYMAQSHLTDTSESHIIRGNTMYNCEGGGIWLNACDIEAAIYGDSMQSGLLVERNLIYNVGGRRIATNNVSNSTFQNNICINKDRTSVIWAHMLSDGAPIPGGYPDMNYNNTWVNNTCISDMPGPAMWFSADSHDHTMLNNILIGNYGAGIVYDEGTDNKHAEEDNLIAPFSTSYVLSIVLSWENPPLGDFRLKNASSRSAGKYYCIPINPETYSVKYAPTTDYDGNPRPIPNPGGTWDCGAYQYQYNNLSAWPYYVLRANDDSTPTSEYWTAVSG